MKTSETMETALLVCLLMLFCTAVGETSFLSLLGLASRKNLVSAQDQALSLGHDLSRCLQVLDDSRKSTMLHCIFWNLSSWTAPGLRGERLEHSHGLVESSRTRWKNLHSVLKRYIRPSATSKAVRKRTPN